MVYLCGRPLRNRGRCTLGRETAIQRLVWHPDGWPRTTDGQGVPQLEPGASTLPAHPVPPPRTREARTREDFDDTTLPPDFQWLRTPYPDELFTLTARPGHLRLYGRETMGSHFRQALVARRQQAHCYTATTVLDFEPAHFQQAAGLVCYYGGTKFHYLHVSHDETLGKHLRVMSALPDAVVPDAFTPPVSVAAGARVHLRVDVDYERLRFAYRVDGADGEGIDAAWRRLPQQFDASILSDEATVPGAPNFTGAFVGVACQDLAGTAHPADFDWFTYEERDYRPGDRRT